MPGSAYLRSLGRVALVVLPLWPAAVPAAETVAALLSSPASSEAEAAAKWARLVRAEPRLGAFTPVYPAVGDRVGIRLVAPKSELAPVCAALNAKGQSCLLRPAPPVAATPVVAPPPPAPPSTPPEVSDEALLRYLRHGRPEPKPVKAILLLSAAGSHEAAQWKWEHLVKAVPQLAELPPLFVVVGDLRRGGYVSLRVSGGQVALANICVLLTEKGQYCLLRPRLN